jgi:hypothetical protein
MELRVQLRDPVQVELDKLDRRQAVPVHQRFELGDRGRVDVDAGDLRRGVLPGERRRGGTEHSEQERQQGGENQGAPKQRGHGAGPPRDRVGMRPRGWGCLHQTPDVKPSR